MYLVLDEDGSVRQVDAISNALEHAIFAGVADVIRFEAGVYQRMNKEFKWVLV